MAEKNSNIFTRKTVYPLTVSIPMIAIAIILSLVDLTFLNDVIGKILDFGTLQSMGVAFALGLIGIVIMGHLGIKAAHEDGDSRSATAGYFILWILLGLAFVMIRLFSASIMQLDSSAGDESLITVMNLNVRQIDLVLAPLMFFLYLATGLMVKDGFKNLYLNPDYDQWQAARKDAKKARKLADSERSTKAELRIAKQQEEAERRMQQRQKDLEEGRIKNALNGSYSNALAQFRAKEKEIKEKYQKISANIDYVKSIDNQEKEFEIKVKPGLMNIVEQSIHSVQNNVALAIRKKTDEDITTLRSTIESHNSRHE